MVLGLIDFLLGGRKKNQLPKSGQVATSPMDSVGGTSVPKGVELPNGQSKPTQNTEMQFEASPNTQVSQNSTSIQQSGINKKPISEVIGKIHDELKSTNERITELVTDIKGVQNTVNSLGHRIDELEESKKISDEKFAEFDGNLSKFLSLYEVINNQYNPFVEKEIKAVPKTIMIDSIGNSIDERNDVKNSPKNFDDLNLKASSKSDKKNTPNEDLENSLLELDTLNIEEAAGNAVPLTHLKNNTNSLVIILSWLEYLIKKVGIEETRNTLRYYTETLRWITPEVYFDLDKYLRGMKDKKGFSGDEFIGVKDHIVSLYFISKLNEKVLDEKLTRAVLQIIKQ